MPNQWDTKDTDCSTRIASLLFEVASVQRQCLVKLQMLVAYLIPPWQCCVPMIIYGSSLLWAACCQPPLMDDSTLKALFNLGLHCYTM
eukprot:2382296-Amphidinium_carterae.1